MCMAASDYAVTADGGDYTVHIVIGMDPQGHLYVLDLWRGQSSSDAWIEAFCDLVVQWKPMGWAEETGQITCRRRSVPQRRMQRARRVRLSRGVSDAGRQSGSCTIDPRPHGAERALYAGSCALVRSAAHRAAVVPGRQT